MLNGSLRCVHTTAYNMSNTYVRTRYGIHDIVVYIILVSPSTTIARCVRFASTGYCYVHISSPSINIFKKTKTFCTRPNENVKKSIITITSRIIQSVCLSNIILYIYRYVHIIHSLRDV